MSEIKPTTDANASKSVSGATAILIDVILIAVISAVVSLALFTFVGPRINPPQVRQQMAVVNFDELIREYIMALSDQVSAGSVPVAEMTKKSAEFSSELRKRLQLHADAGTIVFRTDSVIVATDEIPDITDSLRSDLVASGLLPKVRDKEIKQDAR